MASDIEYEPGDDATWKIVCVLAQTARDLNLQGSVAADKIEAKVYPRLFPEEDGVVFPCVFVMPQSDELGVSDSKHTAWAETFEVALTDVIGKAIHQRQRMLLRWRRELQTAFHNRADLKERLTAALQGSLGSPTAWNVEVTGMRFFENRPDMPHHVFARLSVKVHFKQTRA